MKVVEANKDIVITYIIYTFSHEYYVGKTSNLPKRLDEHKLEKYPHWFNSKKRKEWLSVHSISGDYERKIKSFGIKKLMEVKDRLIKEF